jgi:CRP-like cAMP-binding protein
MGIDEIIDRLYKMPEHSKDVIKSNTKEITVPKGEILLKAGKVETYAYFIKEGIVRAYTDTVNRQVTFWFGREGDAVLSLRSYIAQQKGYEDMETLEDCALYKLDISLLRDAFDTDIHLANFGRRLMEHEFLKAEERLISMQFKTAQERYGELLLTSPDLLQRVPLGHLASYLGITQASLSRIRSNFR